MPSRMEKYYSSTDDVKNRTAKNEKLYHTIYDEAEYSNVEGISILEKSSSIDIEKIKELLSNKEEIKKERTMEIPSRERTTPIVEEEERNYDIREVLDKAKSDRPEPEKRLSNTQYDILKSINFDDDFDNKKVVDDDRLKNMIEAITINSKLGQTGDLLDELKTMSDPTLTTAINNSLQAEEKTDYVKDMDKSFFTSSLDLSSEDFEDLKDMNKNIKKNNKLTKVILFILLVIIVTAAIYFVYNFLLKG